MPEVFFARSLRADVLRLASETRLRSSGRRAGRGLPRLTSLVVGRSHRTPANAAVRIICCTPFMTNRPLIDDATLQAICGVLAETDGGLTNKEIDQLLAEAEIPDPTPEARPGTWVMVSKRDRLYAALRAHRHAIGYDGGTLRFVRLAMRPARYSKTPEVFADRRRELNVAL